MKKIDRYNLISEIALHLQTEMNTTGINVFLGGFGVTTDSKNIVPSKRVYVENLLAHEKEQTILEIAKELGFDVKEKKQNNRIKRETRNNIFDAIRIEQVYYAGELGDVSFLNRMFNLKELPTTDQRFKNMEEDIIQHCVNNDDWAIDWVLMDSRLDLINCKDSIFLQFLCEMLHPVVRPDTQVASKLQQAFNEQLKNDGYKLVEKTKLAGRPIFAAKDIMINIGVPNNEELLNHLSAEYVMSQINLMESAINTSPHIAIGTAKELIETICKTILNDRSITIDKNWDLLKLLRNTSKELKITPEDIADEAKAAATIKRILGSLSNIVQGIAELRNQYGSGHGKDAKFRGLNSRHAKLVVGAASTLAIFLLETHKIK